MTRLARHLGVTEDELARAIPGSLVAVLVGFVACVVGFIRFGGTG
jgi:hypothetical protein